MLRSVSLCISSFAIPVPTLVYFTLAHVSEKLTFSAFAVSNALVLEVKVKVTLRFSFSPF